MSILLDLLFPRLCYGCSQIGSYFCPECTKKLTTGKLNHLTSSKIEAHLSLFNDSTVKQAILDLKYNFVSDLAPSLAKISAYTLKKRFPLIVEYWRQSDFCFIPVPLHHYRQNWRGFNQASLIGQSLAKFLNLPFNPNLVTKTKYTLTQAKTSHKVLRLKNQQNTFSLRSPYKTISPALSREGSGEGFVLPSHIIIFDDVYTTGATSTSLAKIFPKNTSIWILSLV